MQLDAALSENRIRREKGIDSPNRGQVARAQVWRNVPGIVDLRWPILPLVAPVWPVECDDVWPPCAVDF